MKNKSADGLRGVAAFNVVTAHFIAAFLPTLLLIASIFERYVDKNAIRLAHGATSQLFKTQSRHEKTLQMPAKADGGADAAGF